MKIEHIALYVNNLEEARNFFAKYFDAKSNDGYHNFQTDFRSYFLSFDDDTRIEIMNKAVKKSLRVPAMHTLLLA